MSMSDPTPGTPLVTVSIFLFGNPVWEIEGMEGAPVDLVLLDAIATCGQALRRRLERAAEIGRRLVENGWEGYGLLYDLEFYKTITITDAEHELTALGIAPDEVSLREEVEDSES